MKLSNIINSSNDITVNSYKIKIKNKSYFKYHKSIKILLEPLIK